MNEKPQIFESYKINHVCNKLLFLLPRVAWCENCTGLVTRLECLGGNCDLTQHE